MAEHSPQTEAAQARVMRYMNNAFSGSLEPREPRAVGVGPGARTTKSS
jgi:hypothetical protein